MEYRVFQTNNYVSGKVHTNRRSTSWPQPAQTCIEGKILGKDKVAGRETPKRGRWGGGDLMKIRPPQKNGERYQRDGVQGIMPRIK